MRTDRWRALLLAAGLSLSAAAGCAAPSAASDLGRIRELSRLDLPSSTALEEVEPTTSSDARPLLSRPLTAEAAVRVALLNNRELRATLREVGVARGNLVQAGVLPNPEFEVEVTPRQGTLEHTRVELGVEFDLTSAILAPLGERAARADHEAARYRAAGAVVELGYSVRAAFHAAQAAQQRLAIANRALDAFAAARDASRALFEAGNVPELDVATQEAGYEAARLTVAAIELELLERREQLQRLLGLSGAETAWRIDDEIPRAPEKLATPPRAEARALSASLELAELRSRLEAAAGRAGFARTAGWLPDLSVGVRGEREDEAWQVGAGLRVTVPLFDRKQGATMAYTSEFDSLLERYHGRAIDVRSAVRAAQNRLTSAHARALHHQRVLVPARTRVVEQTLLQYNAMQVGVFELLQARREQLDAELAQVEALRDYWTSRVAFDAILAGRRVEVMDTNAPAPMSGAAESGGGH
ncbi:TolC family protein [Sorangium sp. So ce1182]|uniref:TolC family protein n=1 Tax=Sorangium sp. So ce1182 TaxID=3133334 RepID=UPI003F627444